jgi:hypothetical protein
MHVNVPDYLQQLAQVPHQALKIHLRVMHACILFFPILSFVVNISVPSAFHCVQPHLPFHYYTALP